ncbi:unnamed protein product [Larinioides sclopetarius]|uniref:THAP-type domain-containing protein n=1 Tax=Larinioides sclopetarius TaxID=280406 RepID=A0AAV2AVT3_9ARAC
MVLYCCAFNCKENYVKGGPYTFHSFPKDETRRKEWCRLLRRENFTPTNASKICSKHFDYECFD